MIITEMKLKLFSECSHYSHLELFSESFQDINPLGAQILFNPLGACIWLQKTHLGYVPYCKILLKYEKSA